MHLLNTLPQRLDPGATPTFAGLIASSLTSPASTNLTLAGGAGNSSIILTPAGTGGVGIGTTSPNAKLELFGTSSGAELGLLKLRNNANASSTAASINVVLDITDTSLAKLLFTRTSLATGATDIEFQTWNGSALSTKLKVADTTGTVSISSSTAGSASAGALVVTGGLSAGADSYIGGKLTQSVAAGTVIQSLVHTSSTAGVYQEWKTNTTTDRAYVGTGNQVISGGSIADFAINSVTGNVILGTGSAARLTIGSAGATFSGAVTVSGNGGFPTLLIGENGIGGGGANRLIFNYEGNASSRSWKLVNDLDAFGDFGITQSTTRTGSTYAKVFRLTESGNAEFSGTVSPQQATTAAAPAYVKGAIYFDTTLNKLRVGGATAWETITSV